MKATCFSKSYVAELSRGTVYHAEQGSSNFVKSVFDTSVWVRNYSAVYSCGAV